MGVIARRMLPDFARIVGELSADRSSPEVEGTLRVVGMVPPGRAFVERRSKQLAEEVVEQIVDLERAAREAAVVPVEVASMSCGLDRFSVRMSEPVWVGSTTIYDIEGNELHTWRYAAEADADVKELAERAAADVAWVLGEHPGIPVHCIQDAAPELRALPEALARVLPANEKPREFVDFEHLMDYLDEVVDACEPEGDPHDMKGWYRSEFLRDDGAVDRIWKNLRAQGKRLRPEDLRARDAVAKALRYIRNRKDKMRYASSYAANLAIGSGATESTCWLMQHRVKRPAQSWEVPGLRGILGLRALVSSDRWDLAWQPYAAQHLGSVSHPRQGLHSCAKETDCVMSRSHCESAVMTPGRIPASNRRCRC